MFNKLILQLFIKFSCRNTSKVFCFLKTHRGQFSWPLPFNVSPPLTINIKLGLGNTSTTIDGKTTWAARSFQPTDWIVKTQHVFVLPNKLIFRQHWRIYNNWKEMVNLWKKEAKIEYDIQINCVCNSERPLVIGTSNSLRLSIFFFFFLRKIRLSKLAYDFQILFLSRRIHLI